MSDLSESQVFRERVRQAVAAASKVLCLHQQTPLVWAEKFSHAECVVAVSLGAFFNVLQMLNVTLESLIEMQKSKKPVLFSFESEERCVFVKEVKRELQNANETRRVTVKEFFWHFSVQYRILCSKADEEHSSFVVTERNCEYDIVTLSKDPPRPRVVVRDGDAMRVNVSWAINQLKQGKEIPYEIAFEISRDHACKTPTRNEDVARAAEFFSLFAQWSWSVADFFERLIFPVEKNSGLDMQCINDENVFLPVMVLFSDDVLDTRVANGACHGQVRLRAPLCGKLSDLDLNHLMEEERQSLEDKLQNLMRLLPEPGKLIGAAEGKLLMLLGHMRRVANYAQVMKTTRSILRRLRILK